jgi:hypothetical protein
MQGRMNSYTMFLSHQNVEQVLTDESGIIAVADYGMIYTNESYDDYVLRLRSLQLSKLLFVTNHFAKMTTLNLTGEQRLQLAKLAGDGSELLSVLYEIKLNSAKKEHFNLIPQINEMVITMVNILRKSSQEMLPNEENEYRSNLLGTLKVQAKAISEKLEPNLGNKLTGALSMFVASAMVAAPVAIAVTSLLSGAILLAAVASLIGILLWNESNRLGQYGYRLFDGWKSKTISGFANNIDAATQATLNDAQTQHSRLAPY